jgi:hypothetical protein
MASKNDPCVNRNNRLLAQTISCPCESAGECRFLCAHSKRTMTCCTAGAPSQNKISLVMAKEKDVTNERLYSNTTGNAMSHSYSRLVSSSHA